MTPSTFALASIRPSLRQAARAQQRLGDGRAPLAPGPLGHGDRPELVEGALQVVVDDDVVEERVVLDLALAPRRSGGARPPRSRSRGRAGAARAPAIDGGRMKTRHDVVHLGSGSAARPGSRCRRSSPCSRRWRARGRSRRSTSRRGSRAPRPTRGTRPAVDEIEERVAVHEVVVAPVHLVRREAPASCARR